MKTLTTLTSVFLLGTALAQDYVPFHSPTKYKAVGGTEEKFFFAEETNIYNSTLEIKQYQEASDVLQAPDPNDMECGSYGDVNLATNNWLGRNIHYNQLLLELVMDNHLSFNFDLSLGDSAVFNTTNNTDYYLKYISKTQENILNFSDSVKAYAIVAYDAQGNAVTTSFSATPIRIAKHLGAVNFIDIQSFPNAAVEFEIVGQVNTTEGHLGSYAPTYDEVYPWEVGDTLQYKGTSSVASSQSSYYAVNTVTVTNRVETTDSVFISIYNDLYTYNSAGIVYNITYPPVIAFKKGEALTTYPSNYYEYMENYHVGEVEFENLIGNGMEMSDFIYGDYCDSCACFTAFELVNILFENYKYMAPFGQVHREKTNYDGALDVSAEAELIFARVGNNTFGNYHAANVNEATLIEVKLAPNPVTDFIHLSSNERMASVNIYNTTGALLQSKAINSQQSKLDVQRFNQGVYLIQITFDNGQQTTQRFVKQ
ncbi:Por secretion system C-terminal sorting domain-containing protein [Lishizhenia tianjinensis]|uniref:Por secretion system C-terminal sorting domain-containing protein n=1 Tax=Lishizhenia tianjinensis TaxID=477690 RepID=A0A1I7B9Z5_9FLAO|nr:T9SS type A sorting domain-containing protein [Lishizhenia tianjinensis]SFT83978.1 Por secretion system C-terminal sorting domain-containing protein [Lishizhenia tianjinensis]